MVLLTSTRCLWVFDAFFRIRSICCRRHTRAGYSRHSRPPQRLHPRGDRGVFKPYPLLLHLFVGHLRRCPLVQPALLLLLLLLAAHDLLQDLGLVFRLLLLPAGSTRSAISPGLCVPSSSTVLPAPPHRPPFSPGSPRPPSPLAGPQGPPAALEAQGTALHRLVIRHGGTAAPAPPAGTAGTAREPRSSPARPVREENRQ